MKIRGGPERAGPDFSDFFRNGPPGPWDYYLGPWGALGPLFGGAWALYMGVGPCKLISVACMTLWLFKDLRCLAGPIAALRIKFCPLLPCITGYFW